MDVEWLDSGGVGPKGQGELAARSRRVAEIALEQRLKKGSTLDFWDENRLRREWETEI